MVAAARSCQPVGKETRQDKQGNVCIAMPITLIATGQLPSNTDNATGDDILHSIDLDNLGLNALLLSYELREVQDARKHFLACRYYLFRREQEGIDSLISKIGREAPLGA